MCISFTICCSSALGVKLCSRTGFNKKQALIVNGKEDFNQLKDYCWVQAILQEYKLSSKDPTCGFASCCLIYYLRKSFKETTNEVANALSNVKPFTLSITVYL